MTTNSRTSVAGAGWEHCSGCGGWKAEVPPDAKPLSWLRPSTLWRSRNDIVAHAFHDPVDHIGIYAGNGLMVVAPKTGDVVKVQAVYDQPTAIRRVLPPGGRSGDVAAQRAGLLAALSSFTGATS